MQNLDIDHIMGVEDNKSEQEYGQEALDAIYEEVWKECMELYNGQLELSREVILALDSVSTSPLDFHNAKAREHQELCDYSLMSDRPERQLAYELRSMGL